MAEDDDDDEKYEPKFSRCPMCGQFVNVNPGQPTPAHQPPGERKTCPGSGSPAI